jgi:GNAT superfamily N-acetyltransferase
MPIALATSDADILACFPILHELRPHLVESAFLAQVRRMQPDGYQLAVLRDDTGIQAVAGFRIYENLHSGRLLYVDDLVTSSASRSSGHGGALLNWLADHGRARQCASLELDSGTHRAEAHRFYFRERMRITDYHFARLLGDQAARA